MNSPLSSSVGIMFNSLEMKAHIKTATTVVKKGVEQTEYVDLGVGG